jgi:hypothetical protein
MRERQVANNLTHRILRWRLGPAGPFAVIVLKKKKHAAASSTSLSKKKKEVGGDITMT